MEDSKAQSNNLSDDFRPQERLRILAAEYKSTGLEAQAIRERMLRLVGLAVLVMGVIASIPGITAADAVTKSPVFWWCAPAVLGALFAAFVMHYANLNGLVYYRRDLEKEINNGLGESLVLHYENGFARTFYSLRTGDRSMRVVFLALLFSIAGIYVGSVALSLSGLSTVYETKIVRPFEKNLFIGTYTFLALFLVYSAYRVSLYMRSLYWTAKSNYKPFTSDSTQQRAPLPWTTWATLIVARPSEIVPKSLFFWGAFFFGGIYAGWAHKIDALVVWICLELFVNQAKYMLNDIYDTGPDSSYADVRDNPFKGLKRNTLLLFAAAAILKACVGSLLAYWWLGDVRVAIGVFLLLPMQMLYNRARSGFPIRVKDWLKNFRERKPESSFPDRAKAVEGVGILRSVPKESPAPGDSKWAFRTIFLGLLLAVGYTIRLAIPLHLLGFSSAPLLFAGYLAWGTAFGFAFILGYWSWEGAWYAQKPRSFPAKNTTEKEYCEGVPRSKAHTLWCYRKLEERVSKRPHLRFLAIWEVAWSLVLLSGPVLGAYTLRYFLNWRGGWALPIAGGVVSAAAYIRPQVPEGLSRLKPVFIALLFLYLCAAIVGPGTSTLKLPYAFLPSVFAFIFAAHYTAGPWSKFDQRYVTRKLWDSLAPPRRKLRSFFGSLLLPPDGHE